MQIHHIVILQVRAHALAAHACSVLYSSHKRGALLHAVAVEVGYGLVEHLAAHLFVVTVYHRASTSLVAQKTLPFAFFKQLELLPEV